MRNRIALIAALVCTASALAVAGCGGDDEDGGATPLTKDEFITQADAICAAGDSTIDAAGQALGQNPTDEQLTQAVTETVLPTLRDEYDQISALTPPEGDEDAVAAMLDALNSGLEEAEANPDRLFAADADSPFAEANQLAQDYGLKDCGSD